MKVFLSICGVIFALLFLEFPAILGIVHYRELLSTADPVPWEHPANQLDDVLFHIRKPNQVLNGEQHGGDISHYYNVESPITYPYKARYDSYGFRNPKNKSEAPIAILGDSFVESLLTAENEHFVSVLENSINKPVRNLGQLWYGPQQELEVLKRYALPEKPEIIIWSFFEGNDLTDYIRYEKQKKNWKWQREKLDRYFEKSFTKNFLARLKSLSKKKTKKEDAEKVLCNNGKGDLTPLYYYYGEIKQSEEILEALRKTKEIIKEAYELSLSVNSKFIFAFIPSKSRVYRTLCNPSEKILPNEWLKENLKLFVESELEESLFIDLTDSLIEASKNEGRTYFRDDTHWSPLGHRVVGETLAGEISTP